MTVLPDGISVLVGNWRLVTAVVGLAAILSIPFITWFNPNLTSGSGRLLLTVSPSKVIFPILFFLFSLLLRLGYVSRALFPSYFDSAGHYALIKRIMTSDLPQIIDLLRNDYYHLGYHYLIAFFSSVFQTEITTVMLIFGQVVLALLPLPIFFTVKQMTNSDGVGTFAFILSAFGWSMPAHAVDWGKYPALLSIGMILFVLSLVHILLQDRSKLQIQRRVVAFGVLAAIILVTVFIHSRSLIVFGIVFMAWIMSIGWNRLHPNQKHSIFALLIVVLTVQVVLVKGSDILSLLLDPYFDGGLLVTVLVLFLSFFAYKQYPQFTIVCFLTTSLLLASLYIPVRFIPGREYLTLMDRPYVQMILFVPLAILGGLGLAGLRKRTGHVHGRYMILLCGGLVLFHALINYEFYPSDCCVIVGNDDVTAMAWMEDQLPPDARIGIASMELKVVESEVIEGNVGSDAGIWITPLTGRVTVSLPYNTDFNASVTWTTICEKRVGYLFVGEVGYPFDSEKIDAHPEWYRPLLSMPGTRVYEVVGCN